MQREGFTKCFACFLLLATIAVALVGLPSTLAQTTDEPVTFTPQTAFDIPSRNCKIYFAMSGSYRNATFANGAWYFEGLNLAGSTTTLPSVDGLRFSVSGSDCNITVTKINSINVFPPMGTGSVEFTVSGYGAQAININYSSSGWLKYSVYVDGLERAEGNHWNVVSDSWVTVIGAISNVRVAYGAKAPSTLTPADRFETPETNSTIRFARNGSYIFADVQNGTWTFQNLALDGVVPEGAPLWELQMSARNCTVIVTDFLAPFGTLGNGSLNYTVSGVGAQTFNVDPEGQASFPFNYSVYIDGVARPQNDGWSVTDAGWVTVEGAKQCVSFGAVQNVPDWFRNMPPPSVNPTVEPTASSQPPQRDNGPHSSPALTIIVIVSIALIIIMLTKLFLTKKESKVRPGQHASPKLVREPPLAPSYG